MSKLAQLQAANKQLVTIANALLAQHNTDSATINGLRNDKQTLTQQLVAANTEIASDQQQLTDYDAAADDTVAQVQALQNAVNGAPAPITNDPAASSADNAANGNA